MSITTRATTRIIRTTITDIRTASGITNAGELLVVTVGELVGPLVVSVAGVGGVVVRLLTVARQGKVT